MQFPQFLPGVDFIEAAIGLIVITNLSLLAVERQRLGIRLIALQGVILGLLPLLAERGSAHWRLYAATVVFLGVKGVLMPLLLARTNRQLPVLDRKEPYLGNAASVACGLGALVFSMWISERLGVSANPLLTLIFPVAFATIFTGLLLIVTRKRALAQMFGYLITENGIYLLSVPMAHEDSLWLELSILLDILVGVFVMGIAIHHINQAFESTDVDQFASLRD